MQWFEVCLFCVFDLIISASLVALCAVGEMYYPTGGKQISHHGIIVFAIIWMPLYILFAALPAFLLTQMMMTSTAKKFLSFFTFAPNE